MNPWEGWWVGSLLFPLLGSCVHAFSYLKVTDSMYTLHSKKWNPMHIEYCLWETVIYPLIYRTNSFWGQQNNTRPENLVVVDPLMNLLCYKTGPLVWSNVTQDPMSINQILHKLCNIHASQDHMDKKGKPKPRIHVHFCETCESKQLTPSSMKLTQCSQPAT